jgi:polygalacturonase
VSFDAHKNFALSTVATPPSPATSGTSLSVAAGDGSKFPTPPFNAVVWPPGTQPVAANAEIVRVTAVATDTLTITRTQESTSARAIVVGDQISAGITAKTFTDVEGVATDWINVKTQGVKGDGTTDDTAAIQAIFDAAADASTVYFPVGNYRVTATLNITHKALHLKGSLGIGRNNPQGYWGDPTSFSGTHLAASRIIADATLVGPVISYVGFADSTAPNNDRWSPSFEDLIITSTADRGGANDAVLKLYCAVGARITRCVLARASYGIDFDSCWNTLVTGTVIWGIGNSGIWYHDTGGGSSGQHSLLGVQIQNSQWAGGNGSGAGILMANTDGCYFANVEIIQFTKGVDSSGTNTLFSNLMIDTCLWGYYLTGGEQVITGGYVAACGLPSSFVSANAGIHIACSKVAISNVYVRRGTPFVELASGSKITVTGCNLMVQTTDVGDCIKIIGAVSDVVLTGNNTLAGTGGKGINLGATLLTNSVISGNDFRASGSTGTLGAGCRVIGNLGLTDATT